MKYSEQWLKEWIEISEPSNVLAERLTSVGLEVESVEPIVKSFSNVVLGKILSVDVHPQAEKLKVCQVDAGGATQLQIVCGATNVSVNQLVAVAKIGAELPNGMQISENPIRGIPSQGMLCSGSELGLEIDNPADKTILDLVTKEALGTPIENVLLLNDVVFDIGLTPNRGDCLSIRGLAREIAAVTQKEMREKEIKTLESTSSAELKIELSAPSACSLYRCCVIKNIPQGMKTPTWMRERLNRSGVRSIHFLVDVTNYVMLEYGQPMHAFDYAKWQGKKIEVRLAKAGETIKLLDNSSITLSSDDLVIADESGAQALAGVMGGLDSAVQNDTTEILLESAYFHAEQIAAQRSRHGLNSESAYRFERGVDPQLARMALARAAELILEIAGGKTHDVVGVQDQTHFPKEKIISLSLEKLNALSGAVFKQEEVENVLKQLGFIIEDRIYKDQYEENSLILKIKVPSWRHDVALPEDVMEEVIRLVGFDRIPLEYLRDDLTLPKASRLDAPDISALQMLLKNLNYQEIISYSFVDPDLQSKINDLFPVKQLTNPLSKDMSEMRTQLWSGLLKTAGHNLNHGESNLRLFELAICFREKETLCLGGLVCGSLMPEQWGAAKKASDFFSVKGDVENILALLGLLEQTQFIPKKHLALHDGKSAVLMIGQTPIGWIGEVHPVLAHDLEIDVPVFLFELNMSIILQMQTQLKKRVIHLAPKLPSVRRDLALVVPEQLPFSDVFNLIKQTVPENLEQLFLFDRYQGAGVKEGYVSLAIALIFRNSTRTLTEEEIHDLIEAVTNALESLGVTIRR